MLPLGAPEAIFLTGKLVDRQDFTRNLLNRSYFFSIFALDIPLFLTYVTLICMGNTDKSLFSWYLHCKMYINAKYIAKFVMYNKNCERYFSFVNIR